MPSGTGATVHHAFIVKEIFDRTMEYLCQAMQGLWIDMASASLEFEDVRVLQAKYRCDILGPDIDREATV